ncbi:MAG: hypothetical protein PHP46_06095, partial [Candidatus Omnitrophica bacterium]|nr:hypothetical protein [Candidatus Omnitrophota bacterium]
ASAKKALLEEISRIISTAVPEEEMDTAKKELLGSYKINMQTNGFFSLETAIDELYGMGYETIYRYEKEMAKVTSEDLKRVARKYFNLDAYAEITILSKYH